MLWLPELSCCASCPSWQDCRPTTACWASSETTTTNNFVTPAVKGMNCGAGDVVTSEAVSGGQEVTSPAVRRSAQPHSWRCTSHLAGDTLNTQDTQSLLLSVVSHPDSIPSPRPHQYPLSPLSPCPALGVNATWDIPWHSTDAQHFFLMTFLSEKAGTGQDKEHTTYCRTSTTKTITSLPQYISML